MVPAPLGVQGGKVGAGLIGRVLREQFLGDLLGEEAVGGLALLAHLAQDRRVDPRTTWVVVIVQFRGPVKDLLGTRQGRFIE